MNSPYNIYVDLYKYLFRKIALYEMRPVLGKSSQSWKTYLDFLILFFWGGGGGVCTKHFTTTRSFLAERTAKTWDFEIWNEQIFPWEDSVRNFGFTYSKRKALLKASEYSTRIEILRRFQILIVKCIRVWDILF